MKNNGGSVHSVGRLENRRNKLQIFVSPGRFRLGKLGVEGGLTFNKIGFRPFQDAKGPGMPSIGIRPFSDRIGYS
jgi:hypothetical protein